MVILCWSTSCWGGATSVEQSRLVEDCPQQSQKTEVKPDGGGGGDEEIIISLFIASAADENKINKCKQILSEPINDEAFKISAAIL